MAQPAPSRLRGVRDIARARSPSRESVVQATLRIVVRLLLGVVLVSLALVALPSSAGATSRCPSTKIRDRGLTLRANDVRTFGGTSCKVARVVIRRYFQAVMDYGSGCANRRAERGCSVYGYTCRTADPVGSAPSRGRCVNDTNPRRVLRFLEVEVLRT